ncbi:MAG: TatD family hydrolase [Clostridia bacterium]|nr:TatD family hydrolase [Clostridia bacterium]
MYIDTHCHLQDAKLVDLDVVVSNYLRDNVSKVINMGCCLETSEIGKALSERYDTVYFAAGYHPSDIGDFDNEKLDKIKALAMHEKCVAIGEIGLDYYWEGYDKQKQKDGFIKQLELAHEMHLPVSIHSRDATADMLNILKDNKSKLTYGGVMHCFSGSRETATELMNLGLYISFAGTVTFKNATNLKEIAKFVPVDRCLTETDCPYLAPHPLRGTVNEPKNIPLIAAHVAELKGIDVLDFANCVMKNAKTLFKKL